MDEWRKVVDFEALEALRWLHHSDYGYGTCFDYVDSLVLRDEEPRYGVTVFVEPCGDLTKFGDSWEEALLWWREVFLRQPQGWGYITAGWHLYERAQAQTGNRILSGTPTEVWERAV